MRAPVACVALILATIAALTTAATPADDGGDIAAAAAAAARLVDAIASARLGNLWVKNAADSYRHGVTTSADLSAATPVVETVPPSKRPRKKAIIAPSRSVITEEVEAVTPTPADKLMQKTSAGKPEGREVSAQTDVPKIASKSAIAAEFKPAGAEGSTPLWDSANHLRWTADKALAQQPETTMTTSQTATGVATPTVVSARGKGAIQRAKAALADKRAAQLTQQLARDDAEHRGKEAIQRAALQRDKATRAKEAVQRAKTALKMEAEMAVKPQAAGQESSDVSATSQHASASASSPAIIPTQRTQAPEVPAMAVADVAAAKAEETTALASASLASASLRTTPGSAVPAASRKPGFWAGFAYTMALVLLAVGGVAGAAGYMVSQGKAKASRRLSITPATAFSGLASSAPGFNESSRVRCRGSSRRGSIVAAALA